jgi:hypothetical protein
VDKLVLDYIAPVSLEKLKKSILPATLLSTLKKYKKFAVKLV